MLDALKQLFGLAPRDLTAVWHDTPVVIAGVDDDIRFSAITNVEYRPGAQRYEEGHATVLDSESGLPLFELELIIHTEILQQEGPYRLRGARQGVSAEATDATSEHLRLFAGRNALIFSRNKAAGVFPAESDAAFLNAEPPLTQAELDEFKERYAAEAWAEEERSLGNPGGELE